MGGVAPLKNSSTPSLPTSAAVAFRLSYSPMINACHVVPVVESISIASFVALSFANYTGLNSKINVVDNLPEGTSGQLLK